MSLAVDTNVLVHAFREDASEHQLAKRVLLGLLRAGTSLAIPLPCVYEFLRVVTHGQIYIPPTPLPVALDAVGQLLASEGVWLLTPTQRHAEVMREVLGEADATGNIVHDGHIATLMREHGVGEILTEDRDLSRLPGLRLVRLKDIEQAT